MYRILPTVRVIDLIENVNSINTSIIEQHRNASNPSLPDLTNSKAYINRFESAKRHSNSIWDKK